LAKIAKNVKSSLLRKPYFCDFRGYSKNLLEIPSNLALSGSFVLLWAFIVPICYGFPLPSVAPYLLGPNNPQNRQIPTPYIYSVGNEGQSTNRVRFWNVTWAFLAPGTREKIGIFHKIDISKRATLTFHRSPFSVP